MVILLLLVCTLAVLFYMNYNVHKQAGENAKQIKLLKGQIGSEVSKMGDQIAAVVAQAAAESARQAELQATGTKNVARGPGLGM